MINLFFKKKAADCDVEVQVTGIDEQSIKADADNMAVEAYNAEIKSKIKQDLFDRYKVNKTRIMFTLHMDNIEEKDLVDCIVNDIANSQGLLKEVPDDK